MPVIEITSLDHPGVDVFSALTEAQLRNRLDPAKGVFIAESPKVIRVALDAGYEPLTLLCARRHLTGDAADILAMVRDIPGFSGERDLLARLTGYTLTRGVLCAMRRPCVREVAEVCKDARRVVVIHGVVDTTNIGAIFRSAAALNMDAVFLTPGCSDPLYRRASRVSMGTVFQIPWTFIQDNNEMRCQREILWPRQAITELREMGYKTAALALTDDSVGIDNPELMQEEKLAIILGTEGEGLMDRTIEMCDYTVKIPMSHDVDSFNVAAASAEAFWQLGKKQK